MLAPAVYRHSQNAPGRPACIVGGESLPYASLWRQAARLCLFLQKHNPAKRPVVLWGQKQPLMVACMLGCMAAGQPYVPLNSAATPPLRARQILGQLGPCPVLAASPLPFTCENALPAAALRQLCATPHKGEAFEPAAPLPGAVCYILFTSGSSGAPKGVGVTNANLAAFLRWVSALPALAPGGVQVVLNQAAYSFDLSVADLFYALYHGKTHFAVPGPGGVAAFAPLLHALGQSGANLAVCTPSFAQYCLLDKGFNPALLPRLHSLFFCGEPLPPALVQKLWRRFPGLRVVNAYGPTETTVAVCAAEIAPAMLSLPRLPIGKPGQNGVSLVPGPAGPEIAVCNGQVAPGYWQGPAGGFFTQHGRPAYRTGDLGRAEGGFLYCLGRTDGQVKRGGYRIETADIENNLLALPGVALAACVARPACGALRLAAFVQPVPGAAPSPRQLQKALARRLPPYLLPDSIELLAALPLTPNGKIDRKALCP